MSVKTANSRPRTGPLSKNEMIDYFDRGYHTASKRFIAKKWKVGTGSDDEVVEKVFKNRHLKKIVQAFTSSHRAILATIMDKGGRARGENIRRELLLKGYNGADIIIRELVEQAVLLPLPNPGEADLDIEALMDAANSLLQRDIAVIKPVVDLLGPLDEISVLETASSWTGDVSITMKGAIETLELNLLHLTSMLQHEQLRLNKSGTPNRRSLSRFARGITLPGTTGEADDELDLNDTFQMDYLAFLLAMALELGLLVRSEKSIVADGSKMAGFFACASDERDRQLAHTIQNLKYWSEVQSNDLSRSIEEAEGQLSQSSPTGEPLIPARGYFFSLLKRSQLGEWTSLQQLNLLALTLDEDFLPTTLAPVLSNTTGVSVTPTQFVDAIIHRLMYWTGMVDIGSALSEDNHSIKVIHFTPRGRRMIGMNMPEPVREPPNGKGAIIVQPNKEIILFLDAAPLKLAFEIYQVAERQKLSDRVAHYAMTSESVQRGYAYDSNAEHVISVLRYASHAEIPEAIVFELQDWERMHRRQRIYANGVLVRHTSADALDLIIGQLKHENRDNPDVEVIILGPTSAFVTSPTAIGLDRLINRDNLFLIDYLGSIPPQFSFVDPLVIMLLPIEIDIVTQMELDRIADKQEEELGNSEFWELNVSKIRKRWPEDTLASVVAFIDQRCEGGIPASQYITLKSRLEEPPQADLIKQRSVLILEKIEDADVIEKIDDISTALEIRLGPTAFLIAEGNDELVFEVLEELGIHFKGVAKPEE